MIACSSAWASTVGWVGIAWAVAGAYAAWRFTGGRHHGERTEQDVYPPPPPPPPPRKEDR